VTQETTTAEAMSKALDAIHDEAVRILSLVPSDAHEINRGLQLIISLARYKHDIRSMEEIKEARSE
jgi:hypothetical protein